MLLGDCLELEAYIRSNTAYDIYKTVMAGKTSDISQFFDLEWFKWECFDMKLPHSQMTC